MNPDISVKEIIKNATAREKIIWNNVFNTFGERVAVSPFYFCGDAAGTEFMTYNARRLYFVLEFEMEPTMIALNPCNIAIYDHLDNYIMAYCNIGAFWVSGGVPDYFINNVIKVENFLMSRFEVYNGSTYIKLLGFKLGI